MSKTIIVVGDTFGEAWGKQNAMNTEVYADVDSSLKTSQLETTVTNDDDKIPSSGAVVDFVAGMGGGDMITTMYDPTGVEDDAFAIENMVGFAQKVNPLALSQAVVLTAATSGSNGIQVANNDDINFGTWDFTLVWKGSLPSWTPSAIATIFYKYTSNTNSIACDINSSGILTLSLRNANTDAPLNILSTVGISAVDNSDNTLAIIVDNSLGLYGGVSFFVNKCVLGDTVLLSAPYHPILAGSDLFLSGSSAARTASTTKAAYLYNRALSADDVAYLYDNGVHPSDRDGSMAPVYESDFSAGADDWSTTGGVGAVNSGNIDTDADGAGVPPSDDWQRSLRSGSAGAVGFYGNNASIEIPANAVGKRVIYECKIFIPVGSPVSYVFGLIEGSSTLQTLTKTVYPVTAGINTIKISGLIDTISATMAPYIVSCDISGTAQSVADGSAIYMKDFSWWYLGTTLRLEPEGIQPQPGQWLDAANGHHAKLPVVGASLTRPQREGTINWTNTWAASAAAQYVGGINENIFPSDNIRIEWISYQATATGINITMGNQTDTDRYVESVVLTDELDVSSPAHRNHDGTNLKVVITPSGTYTGSITTTIKYQIL